MAREECYHLFYLVAEKNKVVDLSVTKERSRAISQALRDRLGKVDVCRDYTVYSHQNLELTVYPDGSSFCHQVNRLPLAEKKYPSFMGIQMIRKKIANDIFPSRYTYDAVTDTIDVIFPWTEQVDVIIRLRVEENDQNTNSAPSVAELHEVQGKNDTWVEIMVKSVDVSKEVYECLEFLQREIKLL